MTPDGQCNLRTNAPWPFDGRVAKTSFWSALARLTIAASLVFLTASQAPALIPDTGEKAVHIVVEEPQVMDERLADKGISGRSFAETLRFILSTQSGTTTSLAGEQIQPNAQVPVFKLSSSIYKFQNSAIWSGDIIGPDGEPRRLGPVTMVDDAGLKSGALKEIGALIQAHLRRPSGNVRATSISLSCFTQKGTMAILILQDLQVRLRSRIEDTAGIFWETNPKRSCPVEPKALKGNEAVLSGQIEARAESTTIKPVLSSSSFPSALPLASYRGSFDSYVLEREEYLGLTARAVSAVLNNEYPLDSIFGALDARTLTDREAARQGKSLLDAGYTFLALPQLQRGELLGQADILFDLGVAYRKASAPRLAAKIFEQAVKIDASHGGAHKELGLILFNQRKYKEAAEQLKLAGATPGAREKYASVLYLLDDRQGARKTAEEALQAGEGNRDLTLLLAGLDMGEKKFADALQRLKEGLGANKETLGRNLEASYASALKVLTRAALAEMDFETAEGAFQVLIARAPNADNFLLYARAILARSEASGFATDVAARAADMFGKALEMNKAERSENPQFSVAPLERAEALIFAGDKYVAAAREVASEFLFADAVVDPEKSNLSTRSYAPVARLLIVTSDYLTGRATEPPLSVLERDLVGPLAPAELFASVTRPNGEPTKYLVARWSFKTFDKYICTKLSPSDQEIVLALSTTVQRKVGQEITDGCGRPLN
jgi:tetratricopeptide (TPR) repeat protein